MFKISTGNVIGVVILLPNWDLFRCKMRFSGARQIFVFLTEFLLVWPQYSHL
jgi:hypothetical protein